MQNRRFEARRKYEVLKGISFLHRRVDYLPNVETSCLQTLAPYGFFFFLKNVRKYQNTYYVNTISRKCHLQLYQMPNFCDVQEFLVFVHCFPAFFPKTKYVANTMLGSEYEAKMLIHTTYKNDLVCQKNTRVSARPTALGAAYL